MKKYILQDNKGYITEDKGMFIHHFPNGTKQSCSKKEIAFYGGVEEMPKLVYEPVVVEPVIEDAIVEDAEESDIELIAAEEEPVAEIIELAEEVEEPVVEEVPKTKPKKKKGLFNSK